MPHVKTKLETKGVQPQKIPVTKCNMQFVVEKQNAYFYIKTRTRKKPLRCQPGGWNSHLALPKSTGRTPGALQAPEQHNPAFSPTPNDAPTPIQVIGKNRQYQYLFCFLTSGGNNLLGPRMLLSPFRTFLDGSWVKIWKSTRNQQIIQTQSILLCTHKRFSCVYKGDSLV